MKLQELIDTLEKKKADFGADADIECLICTSKEGTLIAAMIEKQAKAMKSALKMFGG